MNFVNVLIAVSLSASAGPDPVRLMFLDASACKFAIMQKSLSETTAADGAKYDQDRIKARADLEKEAPEAIKSAGGSADLENAIKAFYAAADAYCGNPSSAGDEDYKAKKRALDKMLESAGR
jgi:hypothetical protein